ncbi:pilus assembly protein PilM, partial [candidate division WOR-3 bacterium]|nr:pilus assembly protein PilM [candidate division WOR-3 bacterium]
MEISRIKEVLARPVFYTAEKILGLDIGSRFIKVVQVKKTTVGYSVKKVGLKELPLDVIVDGEVMDDTTLVDLIRSFIKEFQAEDTQDKDVALITSGRDVLIKS